MTDREKAIVMAYTGACMLTGDKFQILHKYVEEIMGRPIWAHEMAQLADEIKEKSKADFLALCAEENPTRWIPCSERLPKENEYVGDVCKYYLIQDEYGDMYIAHLSSVGWIPINSLKAIGDEVVAWQPSPQPYKAEMEGEE